MSLCQFEPDGRLCPNLADVVVTLSGAGLPPWDVPTCQEHVDDWLDDVAATARPLPPRTTGTA